MRRAHSWGGWSLRRVHSSGGWSLRRAHSWGGWSLCEVVSQKGMVSGEGSQDVPSPRESWDVHFGGKVVSEQNDHGGVVSEVSSVRRVVCGGDCLLGEWV